MEAIDIEKAAVRPSPDQVEYLVSFLEKFPNIAKGFSKLPSQREQATRTWQKLTLRLNSMLFTNNGPHCIKSWKQWTKYWSDKKNWVKKKRAMIHNSRKNGEQPEVEFTEIEERILLLMGLEKLPVKTESLNATSSQEPLTSVEETKTFQNDMTQAETVENHSFLMLNLVKGDIPVEKTPSEYLCDQSRTEPSRSLDNVNVATNPASSAPSEGSRPFRCRNAPRKQRNTTTASRNRYRQKAMPAPSNQSTLARVAERLLKIKEERLEIDRRNSRTLETLLKHEMERDRVITQALQTTAEGLRVVTEALRNKNNNIV